MQEECDFVFWKASGLKGSCFRFNAMFETCLKSLQELVLSDVQVVVYLTCFLHFKQKQAMMQDRPVQAIHQLVLCDLGPLNWWILCAIPNLVQGSRDVV